jgi:MscS family membrane protein
MQIGGTMLDKFLLDYGNFLGGTGWRIILVLIGLVILTQVLRLVFRKHESFKKTGKNQWKDAFLSALVQPLSYYMWFVVLAFLLNIVLNETLTHNYPAEFKTCFQLFLILMVTWFLLRWKKNAFIILEDKQERGEIEIDALRLQALNKLLSVVIFIFAILSFMEALHQSYTAILTFGGISGLAVAFASQEIIGNFFGGFMVYITRPFGIHDYIQIPSSNLEGRVEEIGWYQTCLMTIEKKPIYVPNSLFSKTFVVNCSRMSRRKLQETFSLRHEDFQILPKFIQEIRTYLSSQKEIDPPESIIINISNIGLNAVEISLSCLTTKTDDVSYYSFRNSVLLQVEKLVEQVGAKLAVPVQKYMDESSSKK